jgi:hypothetical protein
VGSSSVTDLPTPAARDIAYVAKVTLHQTDRSQARGRAPPP